MVNVISGHKTFTCIICAKKSGQITVIQPPFSLSNSLLSYLTITTLEEATVLSFCFRFTK